MKKQFLFWSSTSKIEESNFILSNNRLDLSKLQHFSFCINCAYAVFDSQLMTWLPKSKNLFHDNMSFLSSNPSEFSNVGKNKIKKIFCNHSVVHAISEEGNLFSWGEDTNKTGILGMGNIFSQTKPFLNKYFIGKKVVQLSLSEKHAFALDINQKIYSWGTGHNGELGQGEVTYSNTPNQIQIDKNNIAKVSCGNSYTVLINYGSHVYYFGEIGLGDNKLRKEIDPVLKSIDEIIVSEVNCGPGIIALLDKQGTLYLYNDEEKLYRVKIENKISSVRFANKNIYAMSLNKELFYEFLLKNRRSSTIKNNYYENIYRINPEFSGKLKILDLSFFNSVLFFQIECVASLKDKLESKEKQVFIPLKIQKTEKSLLNESNISVTQRKNTNLSNTRGNIHKDNSNFINSMDLSQSRIESKDINININVTQNYDNSSNISVFPANRKNYVSRKDSMTMDDASNNQNQTSRTESQRHHSLNPFNKKGHRIQKIYNLLGHIFDKKIEEIKHKFSSTLSPNEKVKKYVELERVKNFDGNNKRFLKILEEEESYRSENDEDYIEANANKRNKDLNGSIVEKKNSIKYSNMSYNEKKKRLSRNASDYDEEDQIMFEFKKDNLDQNDKRNLLSQFRHKKSNRPQRAQGLNFKFEKFNRTAMEEEPDLLIFSKNYNINPIKSAKLEAIRYAHHISDEESRYDERYRRSNSISLNNESIHINKEIDLEGYDRNAFSPPLKRSVEINPKHRQNSQSNANQNGNAGENKTGILDLELPNKIMYKGLEIQREEVFVESPVKKPQEFYKQKLGQLCFLGKDNNEKNLSAIKSNSFLESKKDFEENNEIADMSDINSVLKENESHNDNSIHSFLNEKKQGDGVANMNQDEANQTKLSYRRQKSSNYPLEEKNKQIRSNQGKVNKHSIVDSPGIDHPARDNTNNQDNRTEINQKSLHSKDTKHEKKPKTEQIITIQGDSLSKSSNIKDASIHSVPNENPTINIDPNTSTYSKKQIKVISIKSKRNQQPAINHNSGLPDTKSLEILPGIKQNSEGLVEKPIEQAKNCHMIEKVDPSVTNNLNEKDSRNPNDLNEKGTTQTDYYEKPIIRKGKIKEASEQKILEQNERMTKSKEKIPKSKKLDDNLGVCNSQKELKKCDFENPLKYPTTCPNEIDNNYDNSPCYENLPELIESDGFPKQIQLNSEQNNQRKCMNTVPNVNIRGSQEQMSESKSFLKNEKEYSKTGLYSEIIEEPKHTFKQN